MKFSIKNKSIIISLLIIINIVIRLPVTKHAIGVDTFYIFNLAESISTFGYAKWILSPVSYFGVYPYSYPSSFIFILSGVSQSTGISIDLIILIIGIIFSIFGALLMFLLAKEILNNDMYAFLSALTFSLSPELVKFTFWSGSTRGMFIVILPIIPLILLRYYRSIKILLLFIIIFLILLVSSHRVSFFTPLIFFAFIISFIIERYSKKMNLDFLRNQEILHIHIFYILLIISVIIFIIQFLNIGPIDVKDYYTGYFLNNTDNYTALVNMVVDYSSRIGLIFLFLIFGFLVLIGKKWKTFSEKFLIITVILLFPFMGLEDYSPLFILPFFILVSSFGFIKFYEFFKNKKIFSNILLISLMLSTIIFVFFMLNHWNTYEITLKEKTYSSAQFIKDNANGTVISNNGDLASKLGAFSTKPVLPLGGPYSNSRPPGMIVYGFVDETKLDIQPIKLSELSPSVDEFWVALNAPDAHEDWWNIMNADNKEFKNKIPKYQANLIFDDGTGGFWYWSQRSSNLLNTLSNSGNMVYSNGLEKIYSLN